MPRGNCRSIAALGWPVPVFGHVPLIHGPDGAKLSKRHGALGVEAYRDMGYLPEAMRNYLVRLGWSHGDDEIISTEQASSGSISTGSAGRRRASTSRSSTASTAIISGRRRRRALERSKAALPERRTDASSPERSASEGWRQACATPLPGLKERAKTLVELWTAPTFCSPSGRCAGRRGRASS